jgi:hypothetical protein
MNNDFLLTHVRANGPVPSPESDLGKAIDGFTALDFEPAREAAEWLRLSVAAGALPFDTYLVTTLDEKELLGFLTLESMEITVSRGDGPVVALSQDIPEPKGPQVAVKLVWIVRCADSYKGFGEELFLEALLKAREADAVALLVEPWDEATAKRLWIEHFGCRKPREDVEWHYLWHPVREARPASWPS